MKLKKRISILLAITLLTSILAACSSGTDKGGSTALPPQEPGQYGDTGGLLCLLLMNRRPSRTCCQATQKTLARANWLSRSLKNGPVLKLTSKRTPHKPTRIN